MSFNSTSDSKTATSDKAKMSAPPLSIIILTVISLLLAIPTIALSFINYGMLSIWLNSMVAVLIFLYHIVFLIVVFFYRKSFSSADTPIVEKYNETPGDESFGDLDMMPAKPPSIAFNNWSLFALIFLFATNFIAFSIMVNVTTLGAERSTLPAERLGSHKWNIKIQIAQTVVLGCQLLTIGMLLGISAWGRRCIIVEEEARSEEVQYTI